MLLFAILFTFLSPAAKAQDVCNALNCGNLSLEIVRQDINVTATCSNLVTPCTDKFRQISYKVYLRSKKFFPNPNFPYDPFNLDYKMLDVAVRLKNNNTPQYSHIDSIATQNCFENGPTSSWFNFNNPNGDKVIFTPTEKDVSISFTNLDLNSPACGSSGPNNTDNIITFSDPNPPSVSPCGATPNEKCLFVELFTVVVNAYPGEGLVFEFDPKNSYQPKSPISVCSPIPVILTNTGRNGIFNINVGNPLDFTGTANDKIVAELLPPTSNGNGWIFPVQIKNTGMTNLNVTYLEFVLKASLFQMKEPFTHTGSIPRIYSGGTNPAGQDIKYLHYLISPSNLVLMPGGTFIVDSITIGPATLSNQAWTATLAFHNADTKSRIKTTNACTTLNALQGITPTCSISGDVLCIDNTLQFKVEGSTIGCNTSKVNVGLRTTLPPPVNVKLKKVEFELEFLWTSPGISNIGVNFPDWPAPLINCGLFGCYTQSLPLPNVCHKTSADGKSFQYCFETTDTLGPTFSLNDFANMEILFNFTGNGCIDTVKVRRLRITYVNSNDACIPAIESVVGFPICGPMVRGTVLTETGKNVNEVKLVLDGAILNPMLLNGMDSCLVGSCSSPCSANSTLTDDAGGYGFCQICNTCNRLKVVPQKNDNPLNGVTTYDLVLISRHILGTEPLNSPYKMIAADASKSKSISTFDIVELRKLILGIYDSLPDNKSWRFVDKAFSFPNGNNPFQTDFPEGINCISTPASGIDFTGIKIGDVNNSVQLNRPSARPLVSLSWPVLRTSPGGAVTVPISYSGSEPLEAIQLGIRFDPEQLQLISPSTGDIESYLPGNFNLLKAGEGEIRTLWLPISDQFEKVLPGKVLFYLTFKVLRELTEQSLPLWLDDALLDCAAWKPDGTEYAVQQVRGVVKRDVPVDFAAELSASVRPNPTLGDATLVVRSPKAEKSRVALFDAFGRRIFMREVPLREGEQEISLPEIGQIPAGVYIWKVYTPSLKTQGHLVKQ